MQYTKKLVTTKPDYKDESIAKKQAARPLRYKRNGKEIKRS